MIKTIYQAPIGADLSDDSVWTKVCDVDKDGMIVNKVPDVD